MVLIEKSLNGASFIAYMGLAYNILTPAKSISKASYNIKRGNAAAERVLEILEQENQLQIKWMQLKESFTSSISIKNIDFKYEEEAVLKDFLLKLKRTNCCSCRAIWKWKKKYDSQFVDPFYDVNQGQITIDGTDIKTSI